MKFAAGVLLVFIAGIAATAAEDGSGGQAIAYLLLAAGGAIAYDGWRQL